MSTRCAQAQPAQGAATSDARRSPGLPWLRLFVLVVTALSIVALATFAAARGAMAEETAGGVPLLMRLRLHPPPPRR